LEDDGNTDMALPLDRREPDTLNHRWIPGSGGDGISLSALVAMRCSVLTGVQF
jgi:hypothetical protein